MNSKTEYIIGARGSLLSLTQSTITKNELEKVSGKKFTIKEIKTQGDLDTSKPLWQMDGKDFFTKELDQALLSQEVDLVIHSYKDLGSERPTGIKLAAITKRSYPFDILLMKSDTVKLLKQRKIQDLKIGTSSPRRIVNIEAYLNEYLPYSQSIHRVHCEMLRGNVNTRISKLRDDKYHGIILAMAGVERLAQLQNSKEELLPLLDGLKMMVLPASQFPPAASQGALAIEINEKNNETELAQIIKKVHCTLTAQTIAKERASFQSYGGGCHLAVGIHVRKFNNNFIEYQRGEVDQNQIDSTRYTGEQIFEQNQISGKENVFIGLNSTSNQSNILFDQLVARQPIQTTNIKRKHLAHTFVTSKHCIDIINPQEHTHIWTAGNNTWKELAKRGFWVNGSSDGLGHDEMWELLDSQVVQILSTGKDVEILTGENSNAQKGEVTACYTREVNTFTDEQRKEFQERLKQCQYYYWTSAQQFELYQQHLGDFINPEAIHLCGFGKTAQELAKKEINLKLIHISDFKQIFNL